MASLEFFDTVSSPPRSLSPTPLAAEMLRQRRTHSPSSRQASMLPAQSQEGQQQLQLQGISVLDRYLKEWATGESAPPSTPLSTAAAGSAGGNRIRHLVFDCEHVIGIDATAARACFLMLKSLLRMAGVKVHFAAASPPVARLLRGHGVVGEKEAIFPSLDEALEACEEALLRSAAELSRADLKGLSRHPSFYAAARRSRHQSHRAVRGEEQSVDGWIDKPMDGWMMDGWTDGRIDGYMDGWTHAMCLTGGLKASFVLTMLILKDVHTRYTHNPKQIPRGAAV